MLPENAVIKTSANSQEETKMISEAIIARHTTPARVDAASLNKPMPVSKIIYIVTAVLVALGLILAVITTIRHNKLSGR